MDRIKMKKLGTTAELRKESINNNDDKMKIILEAKKETVDGRTLRISVSEIFDCYVEELSLYRAMMNKVFCYERNIAMDDYLDDENDLLNAMKSLLRALYFKKKKESVQFLIDEFNAMNLKLIRYDWKRDKIVIDLRCGNQKHIVLRDMFVDMLAIGKLKNMIEALLNELKEQTNHPKVMNEIETCISTLNSKLDKIERGVNR